MMRHFAADKQKRDDAAERVMAHAWHAANFSRAKKLPNLQTVIDRMRTDAKGLRSTQAHRAALVQLSEHTGIPLRKVTTARAKSHKRPSMRKEMSRGRG